MRLLRKERGPWQTREGRIGTRYGWPAIPHAEEPTVTECDCNNGAGPRSFAILPAIAPWHLPPHPPPSQLPACLMFYAAAKHQSHRSIGGACPMPMLNKTAHELVMPGQGIFPVSISITVQPTLHTSAWSHPSCSSCCCRITSGAIQ